MDLLTKRYYQIDSRFVKKTDSSVPLSKDEELYILSNHMNYSKAGISIKLGRYFYGTEINGKAFGAKKVLDKFYKKHGLVSNSTAWRRRKKAQTKLRARRFEILRESPETMKIYSDTLKFNRELAEKLLIELTENYL